MARRIARLTLERALSLYFEHAPDLSYSRKRALPLATRNWMRFGGISDVRRITTAHFVKARKAAHAAGLAPHTIETMLSQVLTLIRHCGPRTNGCPHGLRLIREVPYIGRRLSLVGELRPPAPMESLSSVYRIAGISDYSPRGSGYAPRTFWRALLVLAYNTALRLGDLVRLRWEHVDLDEQTITLRASKTGKVHQLPVNRVLGKHLQALPRTTDRILGIPNGSDHYMVAQLHELCECAGVPHFTPQAIRRRAACEFERVHPGAGPLLLGHTLPNASRMSWMHYISALEVVLRPASEKVAQPEAFTGRKRAHAA